MKNKDKHDDNDKNKKLFADRLYNLREKTGQSARDMSLSLGQSHNYINGLELKRNYPAMKTFFYICEYLDITPKEFFDYEDLDPKQTDSLVSEIKKLDYKSKEYILGLMQEINKRGK